MRATYRGCRRAAGLPYADKPCIMCRETPFGCDFQGHDGDAMLVASAVQTTVLNIEWRRQSIAQSRLWCRAWRRSWEELDGNDREVRASGPGIDYQSIHE